MPDIEFKYLNKFLDFLWWLWRTLFPGRYKRWLEKQEYIFTHFDPNRISLEMVRTICVCSVGRANKTMELGVRRGQFTEHTDPRTKEKYWRANKCQE